MAGIEQRLQRLEARAALHDVLLDFWAAGDGLANLDAAVGHFTDDAVVDMRALGLARIEGEAAIRACFSEAFRDYAQLAHFGTNFRVLHLDADAADCTVNVIALATDRSGQKTTNHVEYQLTYRRVGERWKIHALAERRLTS